MSKKLIIEAKSKIEAKKKLKEKKKLADVYDEKTCKKTDEKIKKVKGKPQTYNFQFTDKVEKQE